VLSSDFLLQADLSDQERLHFQHLALIRPQIPSESQLQLLEGHARSLGSPRLLTLMSRTPHWLIHWPVLAGLAQNEATPEVIRRDLELVVSLFDQMREMDKAPSREKEERAEMVKAVYQQLRSDLKPIAKMLAKQLAKPIGGSGFTQELPNLPPDEQDWIALLSLPELPPEAPPAPELSREDLLQRAKGTAQADELVELLAHQDHDIRQAAHQNSLLSEELLCRALGGSEITSLFDEVYAEARWYFREPVRQSILDAPRSPEALSRKIALSQRLVGLLARSGREPGDLLRISSLFSQLDETEYQYVTYWSKRHSPQLLRVVKYFYDRLQRQRSRLSSTLPARGSDGQWASLEERVFLAAQTTQADQLAQVLRDPDVQVFRLALENPALTPRILTATVPALDKERAEMLAAHGAWGDDPQVREALLHNPQLSEATALRLLQDLHTLKPLMEILRNPRLPHLEVKRQALEALRALYLALGSHDRIAMLRSTGGELMRHLPQEVLQDEDTLRQLVMDRQLDPSILLRLARNKLTPRSVLEQIAAHPVLMAHPAIMSELLLNPKTPRESSVRIWGLLSESEQQTLLRSPHLPTTLRHLG
jgi:hypothetical protein